MRILSPFSTAQQQAPSPPHLGERMGLLLLLLVAAMSPATQAVPMRMFNLADNQLDRSAVVIPKSMMGSSPPLSDIIPEEELELESLKGSGGSGKSALYSEAKAATKKSSKSVIDSTSISSPSPPTTKGPAYVKKPENEETPALSDNANSLKYGGAHAELEEALANMAHIPPSKGPSLSVSSGMSLGDSILQQQRKRTRMAPAPPANGMGGLLNGATGVNLEVDYTPQDIAEYIFWMGDEHSVEMAINDFIQDGLITPQEAIKFLEEVKAELSSLRSRYSMVRPGSGSSAGGMEDNALKGFWDVPVPVRTLSKKQSTSSNFLGSGSTYPAYDAGKPYYSSPRMTNGYTGGNSIPGISSLEELMDYEETVEKLNRQRQPNEMDSESLRRREYVLHGIIYKLARELFSTGFQQESGNSVPTFTSFIENLAVNGEISKDLERSVLETLVQALVDAANEHGLLGAKLTPSSASSSSSPSTSSFEGQLSSMINRKLATSGNGNGNNGSQNKPIIIKKKSA